MGLAGNSFLFCISRLPHFSSPAPPPTTHPKAVRMFSVSHSATAAGLVVTCQDALRPSYVAPAVCDSAVPMRVEPWSPLRGRGQGTGVRRSNLRTRQPSSLQALPSPTPSPRSPPHFSGCLEKVLSGLRLLRMTVRMIEFRFAAAFCPDKNNEERNCKCSLLVACLKHVERMEEIQGEEPMCLDILPQ